MDENEEAILDDEVLSDRQKVALLKELRRLRAERDGRLLDR